MVISPIFPLQISFYIIAVVFIILGVGYLFLWKIRLYPKFGDVFLYVGTIFIVVGIGLAIVASIFFR
ncbi:MAG: hypothetical protein OWQ54_02590 [Sulfolobaceae archaeon]|nr:hypothetical protein [Sulfolobaceae archaeon]